MSKARSKSGVEVFVYKNGRLLGSRCYGQSTIVIGRGSDATLKLKDASVSKRHAIVRVEGSNVVVADNHSEGGLFVNGTQVTMRAVTEFDEVAIGPFKLKLQLVGAAAEDDGFGDEHVGEEERTQVRRAPTSGPAREPAPALDPRAGRRRTSTAESEFAPVVTRSDGLAAKAQLARASRSIAGGAPHDAPHDPMLDPYDEQATTGSSGFSQRGRDETRDDRRDAPSEDPYDDPYAAPSARSAPHSEELPAPGAVDDDDYWGDDDDDDDFVEPFSLLENVVRERFKAPADTEAFSMVEVIRYRDGEIMDLLRADPGQNVRVGQDNFRLVNAHDDGRAQLFFNDKMSGTIVSGGKARPLKRLCSSKYLVYPKQKIYGVELAEGDYAQLLRDDAGYLVRFVRPPTIPKGKRSVSFNWSLLQVFAGSAAFHFLLLVLLGFIAPEADLREVTDAERFAKINVKDLKLEKPKEEPKKPKEDKPKPKKKKPKPVKQKVKRVKRPRRRIPRRPRKRSKAPSSPQVSAKRKAAKQAKQAKQVLSALANLKPSSGPGRSSLKSLATNIKAIRTPGGTASSFKVAGVIQKGLGGRVRLSGGGGGGGKDTKVGSRLLKGVGKLTAIKGTGTRVRGRVRRAPTRSIAATGGHLSRAAIQRVVSRHMHRIQNCYERQLIVNRGLAGKIVFDWKISPSGSVSSARQVRSTVRSFAVSSCILGIIRRMHFPKPTGGSVQVRYPFVFRVSGF